MSEMMPFPQSLDAERAVLGGVLLDPGVLPDLGDLLPEHFYRDAHGRLWQLLRDAHRSGTPIDLLTVADRLIASGEADAYGGVAYVTGLPDKVPVTENLSHYARIIRDKAVRRQLVQLVQVAGTDAHTAEWAGDAVTALRTGIDALDVADHGIGTGPSLQAVWAAVEAEATGMGTPRIGLGWPEWDTCFTGILGEGMTLFVAASGMGKTSLLNRIALSLALSAGVRVHLHGTETSRRERLRVMAFGLAGLSEEVWASRSAKRDTAWLQEQARSVEQALAWISTSPLTVTGTDDRMDVDGVVGLAERLRRREDLQVLLVDYLQDLPHTHRGGRVGERVAQVGYASQQLKELAGRCGMPVLVGAQRSDEKGGPGPDPRPQAHDVQWSSQAHQDAAEVYTLYREDYYRDRYGDRWQDRGGQEGMVEVIRRKGRSGALRTLAVPFFGPPRWVGQPLMDWRQR
jgi:replicative DNA helicase